MMLFNTDVVRAFGEKIRGGAGVASRGSPLPMKQAGIYVFQS
jgi:hypothetical protein